MREAGVGCEFQGAKMFYSEMTHRILTIISHSLYPHRVTVMTALIIAEALRLYHRLIYLPTLPRLDHNPLCPLLYLLPLRLPLLFPVRTPFTILIVFGILPSILKFLPLRIQVRAIISTNIWQNRVTLSAMVNSQ